jgi:glycosyltransferase involved in cell wall biosynthesis
LRAELESQARRVSPAGRIRFLGARGDVADLLEAADLFVLSSEREGLSVTLLEAMRGGRPAVATRIGGNPEAIADGETGLIVPPGDAPALAQALSALLLDGARAAALGEAGRARWARLFTAERMVGETERLYREELGRVRAGSPVAAAEERRASA